MLIFLLPIIIVLYLVYLLVSRSQHSNRKYQNTNWQPEYRPNENSAPDESLSLAYQKKWMFSYNEKDAYFKLKSIADELGYYVFAKVRLFDILEPIKNHPKHQTLRYKIQAKHVDFVICDERLVARCIIELDDNSHKTKDRKERDLFVDSVLEHVGYKVIHVYAITDGIKSQILESIK